MMLSPEKAIKPNEDGVNRALISSCNASNHALLEKTEYDL